MTTRTIVNKTPHRVHACKNSQKKTKRESKKRAVAVRITQQVAPTEVQQRIYKGSTVTLGNYIGTRLDIDFPELIPTVHIGGTGYGR